MNKRDLLDWHLSGTTVTRPVQDPVAVLLLDNQLYIYNNEHIKYHLCNAYLVGSSKESPTTEADYSSIVSDILLVRLGNCCTGIAFCQVISVIGIIGKCFHYSFLPLNSTLCTQASRRWSYTLYRAFSFHCFVAKFSCDLWFKHWCTGPLIFVFHIHLNIVQAILILLERFKQAQAVMSVIKNQQNSFHKTLEDT